MCCRHDKGSSEAQHYVSYYQVGSIYIQTQPPSEPNGVNSGGTAEGLPPPHQTTRAAQNQNWRHTALKWPAKLGPLSEQQTNQTRKEQTKNETRGEKQEQLSEKYDPGEPDAHRPPEQKET